MKKILLTGGLGFIGNYFFENYSSKYDIKIIDTNYYQVNVDNIKKVSLKDIRDITKEDINGADFIIHMAELSNDPLGDLNKDLTQEINHEATVKLLKLAENTSVQKFIYMSSASVYGFSKEIMSEEDAVKPLTEYSKSKVKNEEYINNSNFNFETIILRNSTAFGFSKNLRLDLVVNDLTYGGFKNNYLKLLSDGTPKRPLVHIHDICSFIDILINDERNLDKEIFNVGDEKLNYSIKEIAEAIIDVLKISDISFGNHDADQRSYELSFEKIKKYFPNFKIEYYLKNGIEDLVKNFRNYEITHNEKRVKILNSLIDNKFLDKNLRWN